MQPDLRIIDAAGNEISSQVVGLETVAAIDISNNLLAQASFKWLNVNTEDEPLRVNRS